MQLRSLLIIPVMALALFGGCGSETSTREASDTDRIDTETAADSESVPADEAVRTYFDAVASNRATELVAAASVTEPDSPADLYRRYMIELNRTGSRAGSATFVDGKITVCDAGVRGSDCATYNDVAVNESGRIVNFFSGDAPLTNRIRANGAPSEASGVTGRTSIAYRTQTGDLFLLVELTNSSGRPLSIYSYDSAYILDGRQFPAEGTGSSGEVRPDATAVLVFTVAGGEFGGELDLDGSFSDTYDSFNLRVPTP